MGIWPMSVQLMWTDACSGFSLSHASCQSMKSSDWIMLPSSDELIVWGVTELNVFSTISPSLANQASDIFLKWWQIHTVHYIRFDYLSAENVKLIFTESLKTETNRRSWRWCDSFRMDSDSLLMLHDVFVTWFVVKWLKHLEDISSLITNVFLSCRWSAPWTSLWSGSCVFSVDLP